MVHFRPVSSQESGEPSVGNDGEPLSPTRPCVLGAWSMILVHDGMEINWCNISICYQPSMVPEHAQLEKGPAATVPTSLVMTDHGSIIGLGSHLGRPSLFSCDSRLQCVSHGADLRVAPIASPHKASDAKTPTATSLILLLFQFHIAKAANQDQRDALTVHPSVRSRKKQRNKAGSPVFPVSHGLHSIPR